jgi:hypothetical protein
VIEINRKAVKRFTAFFVGDIDIDKDDKLGI